MNVSGVCIVTENTSKLVEFYSKIFNQSFQGEDYAYIELGDFVFSICAVHIERSIAPKYQLPDKGGRVITEIKCLDIDDLYNRVDQACVLKPLKKEPWGIKSFWIQDPEGNIISFLEPAK